MVAVNCWSVSLASRTQVTLTFVKMLALLLIVVPGVVALAKGRRRGPGSGPGPLSAPPLLQEKRSASRAALRRSC